MNLTLSEMTPVERYRLLIQTVVPRPIAWILTRNNTGNYNLAPFSYFSLVHSDPPLMTVSIGRKQDGSKKDTRVNIEREKEFVIHIGSACFAEKITRSSLPREYGASEVHDCELDLCEQAGFALPRLRDLPVAMYCRLDQVLKIGRTKQQGLIFGEILQLYLSDAIAKMHDNRVIVDALKLDPLGRFGGNDYGTLRDIVTIERPDYVP